MLELSPTGQCVELLAELVKDKWAGTYDYYVDGETYCQHCDGRAFRAEDGVRYFRHDPDCPIHRARKLLGIKEE